MIFGIPRELVAFAAGLTAGNGNFRVAAATLELLGRGRYQPVMLEMAVRAWIEEELTRPADVESALVEAVDRTRPGRSS